MSEKMKRCIFHIPNYVDPEGKSGSSLRPRKMIQAFKNNGYEVDCVMGYGETRKNQIQKIKRKIENGVKYDFLYAENSTMPTILTEKNHFPRYPFLDFSFFAFCKRNGIKIGLFYRDVYWKFPIYKKEVPLIKRVFSIPLYKYDLKKYKKILSCIYLPSMKMRPYVDVGEKMMYKELPPGCENITNKHVQEKKHNSIRLFYVGGVGDLYDLTELLKTVKELEFVELVICCREKEWLDRKAYYAPHMCNRVNVVHKSGEELDVYYEWADLCMLFFNSEGYRSFAMPIKLFEYIGNMKPVIATENTAAGEFVSQNKLGWTVPYCSGALVELLKDLRMYPNKVKEKAAGMKAIVKKNTWDARANQVIKDLSH